MNKDLFSFLKDDQVVGSQPELETLSQSTLPDQKIPALILFPESSGEVAKIVKICNQHQIPIWYISTGKNWGYGCRAASYNGGVTMIFERMKKIFEVNVELGYAVIEPGVTYADLNNYLEAHNIPLWTDAAGTTETASVLGNALDKGRGLTPYADHFGMLCGMDVILANGERLSTSPVGNYQCQHTYKWGLGPYVEGLFGQSNLGIVVQAGIWLMPRPENFVFFAFEYTARAELFSEFVDAFRALFFENGLISRPHLANDFAMLCIVDKYPKQMLGHGETRLCAEALKSWKKKHGIADWTFGGGLYGSHKQIQAQKQLVKKHLSRFGKLRYLPDTQPNSLLGKVIEKLIVLGARFEGKSQEFISQIFPARDLFKGKPTDDFAKQVYFKSDRPRPQEAFVPANDGCGFIWTGPLVPFTSEHVEQVLKLAKEVFAEHGFDFFVELIVEGPRSLIILFGVFFDPKSSEERQLAKNWYATIHKKMNEAGYIAYRETTTSTATALDGNPKLKEFLAKLKTSLDPNNTLAPERYGISPEKSKSKRGTD